MANCCDNNYNTDNCPATWNWECLIEGFTYRQTVNFRNSDGSTPAPDVSADGFEMVVKDSAGAVVATLTIGDGIEYGAEDNQITVKVGAPITDEAGAYTYLLSWQRVSTSEDIPVFVGKIQVKPAP